MDAVLDYEEMAAARYEDGEGWLVEWLGGWELCDSEGEAWASVALKCAGGLSEPSEYRVRPNVKSRNLSPLEREAEAFYGKRIY